MSGSTAKLERRAVRKALGPSLSQSMQQRDQSLIQLREDTKEALRLQQDRITAIERELNELRLATVRASWPA